MDAQRYPVIIFALEQAGAWQAFGTDPSRFEENVGFIRY